VRHGATVATSEPLRASRASVAAPASGDRRNGCSVIRHIASARAISADHCAPLPAPSAASSAAGTAAASPGTDSRVPSAKR
jgi:hypothetical protein